MELSCLFILAFIGFSLMPFYREVRSYYKAKTKRTKQKLRLPEPGDWFFYHNIIYG